MKGFEVPWRRDWSKDPGAWLVFLAVGVVFVSLGVVQLALGRWIGVAYCLVGVLLLGLSRYAYVRSPRRRPD